jgi:hypothetical protein
MIRAPAGLADETQIRPLGGSLRVLFFGQQGEGG